MSRARSRERAVRDIRFHRARCGASRLVVPALKQNRTSICCLGPQEPSQKIEFVFSASPETIRREPRELISFAQSANLQDLAACALVILLIFFPSGGGF